MNKYMEERKEQGFTLIELLIAIVVVGILTAVAIVGIAGLTNNGKTSACAASLDAAKAATAVHYANTNGQYPTSLGQMVTAKEWEAPQGVTVGATDVSVSTNGWTLTMTPGTGGAAPTYACTTP